MGKRERAREEARFDRGEIGVDGVAVEVEVDPAEAERAKATDELLRRRTYLGRELLTWLLFRSNDAEPLIEVDGQPVSLLIVGKIVLRGLAGEATEIAVKGNLAAYSEIVRLSIDRGLLVHSARLRIEHGERTFEATVDAEHLDVKAGRLPEVLSEEEDDQLSERLYLTEQVCVLLEALIAEFLRVRASEKWRAKVLPEIKRWARGERSR